MKANTLISLLSLSGSALSAAVPQNSQEPWGYKAGSKESIENLKAKTTNVVWLLLENRSFDNILGGVKKTSGPNGVKRDLDNVVNNGPFWNPQLVNDTRSRKWYNPYKDYDSVRHDPDHSVTGNNFEFYSTYTPDNEAIANGTLKPNMKGFVNRQMSEYPAISAKRAADEVMGYYSEGEIPTLLDLVDEFVTFDHWHSAIPGVSFVPHLFSSSKSLYFQ